jgi:hypothetical protein
VHILQIHEYENGLFDVMLLAMLCYAGYPGVIDQCSSISALR